jgi:hypothetical protein
MAVGVNRMLLFVKLEANGVGFPVLTSLPSTLRNSSSMGTTCCGMLASKETYYGGVVGVSPPTNFCFEFCHLEHL